MRSLYHMKKFTLLELMVVIAIIGVLVTMLLPSLQKARQEAERAVCTSNLKQTAVAMVVYSVENNDFAPYNAGLNNPNIPRVSWIQRMYPDYLGDHLATHCPSANTPPDWYNTSTLLWTNLAANQQIVGTNNASTNGGAGHPQEASFSSVRTPTKTSLLLDGYNGHLAHTNYYFQDNPGYLFGEGRKYIARHRSRANVMYMDIHVETHKYTYLKANGTWGKVFWDPTK